MIAPGVWFEAVRIFMRLSPKCPTVIAIGELSQLPLSERPPRVKQFHGVIELSGSGGGYSHLDSAASTTVKSGDTILRSGKIRGHHTGFCRVTGEN